MGDWQAFAGQVFTEWRLQPFNDEPDNAQHVIPSFPIPDWWPKIVAIDWGWDAYTCIGWGAISPSGRLYVYRVYKERQKYIPEWIRDFLNHSGSEIDNIKRIKICHSALQHRGEPKTILEQVNDTLKANGITIPVELGKKDRIGGKLLIHEYLRWKTIPAKVLQQSFNSGLADKINKFEGPDAYEEYCAFFRPENPELLPKVQIFEECQDLIEIMPDCVYDDKNTEDVKEFKGDDPYDMFRMLLENAHEFVNESSREQHERSKIDKILRTFNETGDATRFYRAMEQVETYSGPMPVRRFNKSRNHRRH
jgi:hypothetical protein